MSTRTAIAWTDHTFNPWWGCVKVDPGCAHCYAETFAHKRLGLDIWGAGSSRMVFDEKHWRVPLGWLAQSKHCIEEPGQRTKGQHHDLPGRNPRAMDDR